MRTKEKSKYGNCDKWEEWLDRNGGYPYSNYDITDKIDVSFGTGCTLEGEEGVTERTNYSKTVVLDISSYVGISPGATHVYGQLRVPGVSINGTSSAGYQVPDYISGWTIRMQRLVNQEELDRDAKQRYDRQWEGGYKAGDHTDRFDTEEELIAVTKKFFEEWFTGFELKIDD